MSRPKTLFFVAFLLLFSLVSTANSQGGCIITSSLSEDPYGKTEDWKEITLQIQNTENQEFTGVNIVAVISAKVENPLDGSEDELVAEIWNAEESTWLPANVYFDEVYKRYAVILMENTTIPANGTVEALFRLKFAGCRSALYEVDFQIISDGNVYESEKFPLAITDSFEPDDSFNEAREIEVGSPYECFSLLPYGYDSQDWFRFTVEDTGVVYVVETYGCEGCDEIDTYLYLYADPESDPVASDDDSGEGLYSKVYYYFEEPGEYFIKVMPYDEEEQGYYGIRVTTMQAQLEINGNVYDYEGGADFSAYAKLYNLNGNVQSLRPVVNGQFSFTVPAGDYKLEFAPHPDSGLVAEWYLNRKSFDAADIIKLSDAYFDEEEGKFIIYLEDSYLAYEDTAPEVTIISPEQNAVFESYSIEASFKVVEDSIRSVSAELYDKEGELVDGHFYGRDFETGTTYTASFQVDSDCNYRLVVTAEDESGNVVSKEVEFFVDTEIPGVSLQGFEDGGYYVTTITPVAVFEDEHLSSTSVVLFKDGEPLDGWNNGVPVYDEGKYEIYAEAVDVANNVATASASFTIDRTPPLISFTGVEDGVWYNREVTPSVVFEDENIDSTYAVLFKDGEPVGWSNGEPVTEEGCYEIFAWAVDMAGNEATASVTFYIDTTPPQVSITSPEDGETYCGTITVDATYSAEAVSIKVYVDDNLVATEVPFELDTAQYADGTHTVTVMVCDRAGNTGVDSVDVIFDNLPPIISIRPEDGAYVSAAEIVPEITIYDVSLEDVYCFLNDNPYSIGTTITGEGSYKLEVIASDIFGRVSKATSRFVLDATPPQIDIRGVEDGKVYNAAVSFSFTATDENLREVHGKLNGENVPADTTITVSDDGAYILEVHAVDMAGNEATASVTFTVDIPASAERIWGTNRYATAVEISKSHFEDSEYVVIATGENFPDALAAAPLAKALDAPILLVRKDSVPAPVVQEINRLNAEKAIIIGGTGAVSDSVMSALGRLGLSVERIGGRNRYETAMLVSEKLAQVLGVEAFDKAYIATGENFPDALSVSAIAAAEGCPILLVRKFSIPAETRAFIEEYGVEETVVVGGTGVISEAVKNNLPNATRLAGANRYATSVEVVRYALENEIVLDDVLYISTGENYPDALACGSAASRIPAAVLLVPSRLPLRAETENFLSENTQINEVVVIGGTGAVSDLVVERIRTLLSGD